MITPEIRINTKCPVPTGTDCSQITLEQWQEKESRPYGDGLFPGEVFQIRSAAVPSLRGRIVLKETGCVRVAAASRPYGDGLF